jgi:hypothetical protein
MDFTKNSGIAKKTEMGMNTWKNGILLTGKNQGFTWFHQDCETNPECEV